MEFQRISSYKLKITLDEVEREQYGIDTDGSADRDIIRAAIAELLTLGGIDGFGTEEGHLLVRIYPSRDGGAELYLTRIMAGDGDGGSYDVRELISTYYIEGEDALVRAARAVESIVTASRLYRADRGYLLRISEESSGGITARDILAEFGEKMRELPIPLPEEWYPPVFTSDAISHILAPRHKPS